MKWKYWNHWVVATQIFYWFSTRTLGRWWKNWLLHIFQMGWFNHQLVHVKCIFFEKIHAVSVRLPNTWVFWRHCMYQDPKNLKDQRPNPRRLWGWDSDRTIGFGDIFVWSAYHQVVGIRSFSQVPKILSLLRFFPQTWGGDFFFRKLTWQWNKHQPFEDASPIN